MRIATLSRHRPADIAIRIGLVLAEGLRPTAVTERFLRLVAGEGAVPAAFADRAGDGPAGNDVRVVPRPGIRRVVLRERLAITAAALAPGSVCGLLGCGLPSVVGHATAAFLDRAADTAARHRVRIRTAADVAVARIIVLAGLRGSGILPCTTGLPRRRTIGRVRSTVTSGFMVVSRHAVRAERAVGVTTGPRIAPVVRNRVVTGLLAARLVPATRRSENASVEVTVSAGVVARFRNRSRNDATGDGIRIAARTAVREIETMIALVLFCTCGRPNTARER